MNTPIKLLGGAAAGILYFIWSVWDIFLFILSLKVLPLAWHIRNYSFFLSQYLLDKRPLPPNTYPTITLFQPTILSSSTPLGEMDIMGHKSNSTYFTDFDAARNYHFLSLFRVGLRAWSKQGPGFINTHKRGGKESEPFYFGVGGVASTFRKGIKPRQKYDIVTQVLSWDEKWVYFISHFVKKGTFKPTHFSDQPRRNKHKDGAEPELPYSEGDVPSADSTVLAISVGKMVFKKGRKTIPPVEFLRDCGHLPLDENTPSASESTSSRSSATMEEKMRAENAIEERRARGMRVAQGLKILDEGLDLFDPRASTAFARGY